MSVRAASSEPSTLRLIVSGRLSRPPRSCPVEVEAELRRDHDLVADGLERLADELLVRERPVDLRGVEEGDAALDRRADQRDHLLPVGGSAGSSGSSPMQPSPIAETSRLPFPSVRVCIASFQVEGMSLSVAARASGLTMESTMPAA